MTPEPKTELSPGERVNRDTFGSDAEHDKYFRFGLTPREEELVRRYFVDAGGRPGGRVLDVGCGYGRTSRPLAALGFDVTAIDIVPRMVAEAQAATRNVRFSVMSATDLAFPDGAFDHVLFSANGIDCIGPAPRRQQALREMRRMLRPGGVAIYSAHSWSGLLLAALWSPERRAEVLRNARRRQVLPGYFTMRQAGGDLVLHYGTPWAEARRARRAGFTRVHVHPGKLPARLAALGPRAARMLDLWPYYVAVA